MRINIIATILALICAAKGVAEDFVTEPILVFDIASHSIIFDHDSLVYMAYISGLVEKGGMIAKEGAKNVQLGLIKCLKTTRSYFNQRNVSENEVIPHKIINGYIVVIAQADALLNVLDHPTIENNEALITAAKAADEFITKNFLISRDAVKK